MTTGTVVLAVLAPAGRDLARVGDPRTVQQDLLVAIARILLADERRETNYLLLRRGPYVVAAGLDESVAGEPTTTAQAGSRICSIRNFACRTSSN